MGAKTAYYCDRPSCGQSKKDTNHWWMFYEEGEELRIFPFMAQALSNDPDLSMACSKECLQKILENWMNEAIVNYDDKKTDVEEFSKP